MKDIIQLNTGSSNVLLVSLPEGAHEIKMSGGRLGYYTGQVWEKDYRHQFLPVVLPPGNWIEVGWSDSLTEAQAKELVESSAYKKFMSDEFDESTRKFISYGDRPDIRCNTALESWQSLLSANNIKEKKFVLIDNK